jgi:hypothetical protein
MQKEKVRPHPMKAGIFQEKGGGLIKVLQKSCWKRFTAQPCFSVEGKYAPPGKTPCIDLDQVS